MSTVKIFDAGNHLVVSGESNSDVKTALDELVARGARSPSSITQNGKMWVASCENPAVLASSCEVNDMGMDVMITGPTREAVAGKIQELHGSNQISDIEQAPDGKWVAVCDKSGFRAW